MPDRPLVALAACLVVVGGLACSSSPEPEPDDPDPVVEQPTGDNNEPAIEVREAFEDAAGWLPREATAVFTLTDPTDHRLGRHMLPVAESSLDADRPGSAEALQADLEELFVDHLGFDLTRTDAAVAALQIGSATVVLLGDYDTPEGLPEIELEDRTAYRLDADEEQFDDIEGTHQLYLMPVDQPRPGLVVAMSVDQLERLAEARRADDGGHTLASGARAELFHELFEEAEGSWFAVVSALGDLDPFVDNEETPMPRAALLNHGDVTGLTLRGEDEELDEIQRDIDARIAEFRDRMEESYEEREGDLLEEFSAVYGYHGFESIAGQLEPETGDGRLRYELETDEMRWGRLWLMSLFVIGGLWDATESFEDWTPPGDDWSPPEARLHR